MNDINFKWIHGRVRTDRGNHFRLRRDPESKTLEEEEEEEDIMYLMELKKKEQAYSKKNCLETQKRRRMQLDPV